MNKQTIYQNERNLNKQESHAMLQTFEFMVDSGDSLLDYKERNLINAEIEEVIKRHSNSKHVDMHIARWEY